MKKQTNQLIDLFARYMIILLAGLGNLFIFYKIFTPITIKTLGILLNLFTKTTITNNLIISADLIIEIIPACVAGSAYYLLLILALSVPNLKLIKRIQILFISFASLFIFNIIRIIFLALINQSAYFETTHLLFWYALSTLFVVGIWILLVKTYKIKSIPVYSDLRFLYELIQPHKKLIKPIKKTKRRK